MAEFFLEAVFHLVGVFVEAMIPESVNRWLGRALKFVALAGLVVMLVWMASVLGEALATGEWSDLWSGLPGGGCGGE